MNLPQKIYVAGHRGMLCSVIVRHLQGSSSPVTPAMSRSPCMVNRANYAEASTPANPIYAKLDSTKQTAVEASFSAENPTIKV